MSDKFSPYSADGLPKSFNYPEKYLKLSKSFSQFKNIPYFSWWFIDNNSSNYRLEEASKICFNLTGIKI